MTANTVPYKTGEELLNATQVAERMNVVTRYPLMLAKRGELPCLRIGPKCVRFRRQDVEEFLASKLVSGKENA